MRGQCGTRFESHIVRTDVRWEAVLPHNDGEWMREFFPQVIVPCFLLTMTWSTSYRPILQLWSRSSKRQYPKFYVDILWENITVCSFRLSKLRHRTHELRQRNRGKWFPCSLPCCKECSKSGYEILINSAYMLVNNKSSRTYNVWTDIIIHILKKSM